LAFPLIAGPGSLLVVVLLMTQAQGNLLHIAGVLAVLAICLGITFAARRWPIRSCD
jgi:small neutral amino acid transporter SnatA (MarC family)